MMATEGAILLKDVNGEKSYGKIGSLFKSSSKLICCGELLLTLPRVKVVSRKDRKPAHNYHLANDPSITLFCNDDEVATVSDREYHLMEAIRSREARIDVFQKHDILDWGSKLKEGTSVLVTLPSKYLTQRTCAVSVIKYIGPLPYESGIQFGVEITVCHIANHEYYDIFILPVSQCANC